MAKKQENLTGGLILIGIGVLALVTQFVDWSQWGNIGIYFLPALGVFFLLVGVATRSVGPIIPGGILSGIGLGTLFVAGPLKIEGVDDGGVFMLAFAAGWAVITLFSAVFTSKTQWWPLIPGGIMAIIGAGVLFGGVFMQFLALIGKIWPVALIIMGVYILWHTNQNKSIQD